MQTWRTQYPNMESMGSRGVDFWLQQNIPGTSSASPQSRDPHPISLLTLFPFAPAQLREGAGAVGQEEGVAGKPAVRGWALPGPKGWIVVEPCGAILGQQVRVGPEMLGRYLPLMLQTHLPVLSVLSPMNSRHVVDPVCPKCLGYGTREKGRSGCSARETFQSL